ncbi:hypothetical protein [Streptomyces ureilyticus]|uniref:Uncharacterized protein n=1 Tax=Streptomyces ureilyticus TaxID=1775131 RepID=A0ABX0E5L0_9ACTN|nr:hypothetical protein [Streptomyces ureilyticus]NGO48584.1 hypothetical protein [Streptomyces ureilyticus]
MSTCGCGHAEPPDGVVQVSSLYLPEAGIGCGIGGGAACALADLNPKREPGHTRLLAQESGHTGTVAPYDPDARARYRWTVGHQAAFMVWRLTSEALMPLATSDAPNPAAVAQAALLQDICSALFVYTGSCSADRYAATVRTDMRACAPAFSGEWAADYAPLPGLLHRVRARHPAQRIAPLLEAVTAGHQVHRAMAARLVPGGASLLRQAGRRPGLGPTSAERTRYDTFFRVERRPVCQDGFNTQLLCRAGQMLRDIAVHGLDDADAPPLPLGEGPVVSLLQELATTVTRQESPVPL